MLKKIYKIIYRKQIGILRIIGEEYYQNAFIKYLKKMGVDFTGKPKYIHADFCVDDVDFTKLHIGNDVVISKHVTILVHDYAINCAIRKIKPDIQKEQCQIKDVYN